MDLREIPTHAFHRHPWEKARANFFARVLRKHVAGSGLSVVDFGAGDGFFAQNLIAVWPAVAQVVCFDSAYPADSGAPARGKGGVVFTARKPDAACDVLLLLDVIEHVPNDQATLHDALSSLEPGGWLLLSAPAHPILFSRHDELLGHKRRYSPAGLLALAKNEGLAIVEHGQLFASLLVPRALAKLGEAVRPRDSIAEGAPHVETSLGKWRHGALVTRAVETALGLDAALGRALAKARIPGLSTWVLARKP